MALVAALWTTSVVSGQDFRQLATNLDGSVLYFSSTLRMKGTSQYSYQKIFKWDSVNGLALYGQRESDVPFPTPPEFEGTHFFLLTVPDVSSDGTVVAVTGVSYCNVGQSCIVNNQDQSTIYNTNQPTIQAPGSANLSRNGNYVLLRSSAYQVFQNTTATLLDLQTGQETQYSCAWVPAGGKHQVSDAGTVVLATMNGFAVGQGGQLTAVAISGNFPDGIPNPLINAGGSLVIYQSGGGGAVAQLSVYSLGSGSTTATLASEAAGSPNFLPSISDDGSLVAFVNGTNGQA